MSFHTHITPVTPAGQDSPPDVGQPVIPCLSVVVRDDFQLLVLHSLTGKQAVSIFKHFIDLHLHDGARHGYVKAVVLEWGNVKAFQGYMRLLLNEFKTSIHSILGGTWLKEMGTSLKNG